ncbi:MAG: hypothetical protein GY858_06030 [Candidatus Omnitrophica bacterium]|nr:hypothetical protein [Candidatus Omnitrophota bacterium]
MKYSMIFVCVFAVFFCGCDEIPFLSKKAPKQQVAVSQKVAKEEVKIKGPLLARVNSWAIGLDDFDGYLNSLRPLAEAQELPIDNYEFKARLLNDLVKNQVLAQIAIEQGLDKDEDIARAMRDYKTTLLSSKIRASLENTVVVSYTELEEFYEKNKAFLRKPQEVDVSEIALNSEFEAKEVYIKILQGEEFSSLARRFSVLDSAKDGGALGFLTYDPEIKFQKFWETAAALKKGATSNIFQDEVEGKWYIVKLNDVRGGQEIPLAEVEENLKAGLKANKIEEQVTNMADSFKARAKVEINEDLIN